MYWFVVNGDFFIYTIIERMKTVLLTVLSINYTNILSMLLVYHFIMTVGNEQMERGSFLLYINIVLINTIHYLLSF